MYRFNKTLQALAPIAYVLRNIKFFPWPKIATILNFHHHFPKEPIVFLIRATKDYAKTHNLEPPLSQHNRPNMLITYNLYVLGMPASDIFRFQSNQLLNLRSVYNRIDSLSKSFNIPNPIRERKKPQTQFTPVLHINPLPSPVTNRSKATPVDTSTSSSKIPYIPNPLISNIPSVDKAILAIELLFVDKIHPNTVADTLHFKSVKSLLYTLNYHLKKAHRPPFSYKDLFAYYPHS